jgi:hypothetical protein
VPFYAGRDFTDADNGVLDLTKTQDPAKPLKLIVNRALVDRFLPGENPLGQRLAIFWGQTLIGEIIGVVGNVRYQSLAEEEEPTFLLAAGTTASRRYAISDSNRGAAGGLGWRRPRRRPVGGSYSTSR